MSIPMLVEPLKTGMRWIAVALGLVGGSARSQTLADVLNSLQERNLALVQREEMTAELQGWGSSVHEPIEWAGLPESEMFHSEATVDALDVGARIALLNEALLEFENLYPYYLNLRPEDVATGNRIGALRPFMQEDFPPLPRVDAENFPVILADFGRQIRHLKVLPWVASLRKRDRDYYAAKWEVVEDGDAVIALESDNIAWQPASTEPGELDQDNPNWITVLATDPYSEGIESITAGGSHSVDSSDDPSLRSSNCWQSTTFFSDAKMPVASVGATEAVGGTVALVSRTESNFVKADSYEVGGSGPLPSEWNPEDGAFHVIALSAPGGSEEEISAGGPDIRAKLTWSALEASPSDPDVSYSDGGVASHRTLGSFGQHSSLRRTIYPVCVLQFSRGLDAAGSGIPAALARSARLNRPPAGDARVALMPRPGLIAAIPLGVGLGGDASPGWIGISPGSYDFMTPDDQPSDLFAYGVISPAFNSGAGYTSADLGIRFDFAANLRFVGAAEDFHVVYATGRGADERGSTLPTDHPTKAQYLQSGWESQSVLTAWDLPRIRQIVGRDLIADVTYQGHYKATVTVYRRPADAEAVELPPDATVDVSNLTALRTLVWENPDNTTGELFPDSAEAVRITDGQTATYTVRRSSLDKDAGTITFTGPSRETTVTLTSAGGGRGATFVTELDAVAQGNTTLVGDAGWRWWGYRQPATVTHVAEGETRISTLSIDASLGCRGGRFPRTLNATGGSDPDVSVAWDADGIMTLASRGPWRRTTTPEGTSGLKTVLELDTSVWATRWTEWAAGGRKVTLHSAPDGSPAEKGDPEVAWTEIEYGDTSASGYPGIPAIIRNSDGTGTVLTPSVNAGGEMVMVGKTGKLDGNDVTSGETTSLSWSERGYVTSSKTKLVLGAMLETASGSVPEQKFTAWGAPTEWKNDHNSLVSTMEHDGAFSRLSSFTSALGLITEFSNFDALDRAGTVATNGITATNTFTARDVQTTYAGTDVQAGTQRETTRDSLGRLTADNTTWNGVIDNLGLVHGPNTVDATRTIGPYGTHTSKIRQIDGSLEKTDGATLPFGGLGGDGLTVSDGLLVTRTELLGNQGQPTGTFEEVHTDAFGRVRKVVTPSKSGTGTATTTHSYSNPNSALHRVITTDSSDRVLITETDPFHPDGSVTRSGIDVDENGALGGNDRYTKTVTTVTATKSTTILSVTDEPGPGVVNGMREVMRSEWTPSTGVTETSINGGEETITSTPVYTYSPPLLHPEVSLETVSSKGWTRTTVLNSLGLPTTNTLSGTGIPTTELTPVWRADGSLASVELERGGESHTAGFNHDGTLSSLTVPGKGNILGGHNIDNGVETLTVNGVTVESQLNGTGTDISGGNAIGRSETLEPDAGGFKHTVTPDVGGSTDTLLSAGFAPTSKNYADNSGEIYDYEDELLKSVTLARGGELEFGYSGDGAQDLTTATWPAVTSGDFSIPGLGHGFSYTRAGQIKTVADPSGSRTLGYEHGRLVSTLYTAGSLRGYEVIRAHDGSGRHTGTTLERDEAFVHSVERAPNGASDQITALASGTVKVVPQRDAAGRITGYQWGNATGTFVPALTQTWQRGAGGRIEYAGSDVPGAPSFDYLLDPGNPGESFDTQGRRLKCETEGGVWSYTYGLNGQIERAVHRDGSNEILLGDFQYDFDAVGRRKDKGAANFNDLLDEALLNQTTAWSHDQIRNLRIRALPGSNVRIEIGDDPQDYEDLTNFSGDVLRPLPAPGSNGLWVDWCTRAVLPGAGEGSGSPPANPLADPDAKAEKRGSVWIPPASETLAYDDAGNRQGNAQWDYGWDAKNQLVHARTKDYDSGPQGWHLQFTYDAEGRRTKKHVVEYRDGERVSEKEVTFVWDGWDLLYERHQLPSGLTVLERKYLWGPDILDGAAGGAGGLLLIRETKGNVTTDLIPLYDGTGHVIALTNLNKDLLATYAYGPFGEKISANGPRAQSNPWRYATKYLDEETGLYYFGQRYLDPVTGQWLSREPLGESESVNLYSYCQNDPVNKVDRLGLDEVIVNDSGTAIYHFVKELNGTRGHAMKQAWDHFMHKAWNNQREFVGQVALGPVSNGIVTLPNGATIPLSDLESIANDNQYGYSSSGVFNRAERVGFLERELGAWLALNEGSGADSLAGTLDKVISAPIQAMAGPGSYTLLEATNVHFGGSLGVDLGSRQYERGVILGEAIDDGIQVVSVPLLLSPRNLPTAFRASNALRFGRRGSQLAELRALGSRGVRNEVLLTDAQWGQITTHIDELGLSANDFLRCSHVSGYSDMMEKVLLGPNVFPASIGLRGGTVFERLTPRAVIAHEAGHMITTKAGSSFAPGSLLDEVGASLTGRGLPGLSSLERYQLLRDAAERARNEGTSLRLLLDR